MTHQHFDSQELRLPYTQWKALIEDRRQHLAPEQRRWLHAWQEWDLACSPMDDEDRRNIRYGHHLGWLDHMGRCTPTGT